MNEQFLLRMKDMLKDEFDDYLKAMDDPMHKGLRINTLKWDVESFKNSQICEYTPTSLSEFVFEIPEESKLGKTIEHHQGLFYLQEVSACSAVEVLDPKPGDFVLDLCAAPGGKSTQIAMKLEHQGLLISNEIDSQRAQILLSNCERCGISNAIITNSAPEVLCPVLEGCMDKVLVDAPCSGEGMFRKHSKAMEDWSEAHVKACALRQKRIVDEAVKVLKPGGIMVYSTCTYAIEENEEVIDYLLQNHPEMELLESTERFGRAGFDSGKCEGSKVRRIFLMDKGEGHFVARLRKKEGTAKELKKLRTASLHKAAVSFLKDQLDYELKSVMINDKVYLAEEFYDLKKVRVLRQGILAGEIIKERFEPHQHFYSSALLEGHYLKITSCSHDEMIKYIQGEQLNKSSPKGFTGIEYQGHLIGFGKSDGMIIKNRLPKGLRQR